MTPLRRADWRQVKLGEVVEFHDHKRVPLSSHERSQRPGPHPYYGASGIIDHVDGYLFDGRYLLVAEDGENLSSRHTPVAFMASGRFWVNNHAHVLRGIPSLADDHYLMHYLQNSDISGYVTGTAQPKLSQANLRAFELCLPPLATQRKIAAILSAYDDLIEVNQRRIQILEEMARLIYREWFVHFRFPGHEKVGMVDSPLGRIPEGWEVKSVGQAIDTLGGGTPSTVKPEYWEGGDVTWFTPSDLTAAGAMFIGECGKKITRLGLERSSAKLFPPHCIMMTSRATIGVTAINRTEACTNQGFIVCVPNDRVSAWQMYYWIEQNREAILGLASGATYKEIGRGEFREFLIVVADHVTNQGFVQAVAPVARLIDNLLGQNRNLRLARDLLLPRLISGEVDVSEMDIALPAEAEARQ